MTARRVLWWALLPFVLPLAVVARWRLAHRLADWLEALSPKACAFLARRIFGRFRRLPSRLRKRSVVRLRGRARRRRRGW